MQKEAKRVVKQNKSRDGATESPILAGENSSSGVDDSAKSPQQSH